MLRVNRSKPRELQEHEDEGQSLPGRWVNSHELRAGDCIITRSGTRALITEIRQRFDDAFPVSNLSIIGHHNYAVGDVGGLVHNVTVCDETIADLRKAHAQGTSGEKIRDWLRSQKDENGKNAYNEKEIDTAIGKILGQKGEPHYAEWELNGPRGRVLAKGDELSGVEGVFPKGTKLTFPEQSWWGHTEGKIIGDLMDAGKLGKGKGLTIRGTLPPCSTCRSIMEWASKQFGMVIEYVDGTGKTWVYINGVLNCTLGDLLKLLPN